jgi:uncharacterized membrane protein YvbJ
MFCTKCGQQLPDNANFCSQCGAPLREGVAKPAPTNDEVVLYESSQGYRPFALTNKRLTSGAPGRRDRKEFPLRLILQVEQGAFFLSSQVRIYYMGGQEIIQCDNREEARKFIDLIRGAIAAL